MRPGEEEGGKRGLGRHARGSQVKGAAKAILPIGTVFSAPEDSREAPLITCRKGKGGRRPRGVGQGPALRSLDPRLGLRQDGESFQSA